MSRVFIRSPYNYETDLAGLTGELPQGLATPLQGDFTSVTDFQSAMDLILKSQQTFMEMPADVRTRFDNDPHRFLDFVSDTANRDEARKLGLLIPEPPAPPPAAPPAAAPNSST